MALQSNELYTAGSTIGPKLRFSPEEVKPKTFAAGTGTLAVGTAVAFNTSSNNWVIFGGQVNEEFTITANATPNTGGTFTLTHDGNVTSAIAFDATAADVEDALEALASIGAGNVQCTQTTGTDLGDANAVVTIEFINELGGQVVALTIQDAGLTGGSGDHALANTVTGGTDEANGANLLKGFVWPDPVVLNASGEVIGNVMLRGEVHFDDIPVVGDTYGKAELRTALRSGARELGIKVQGLDQVR